MESEWSDLEDSARYPEGIECPHCGKIVLINQYHTMPKFFCLSCNSTILLNDRSDNCDVLYTCPNCGDESRVILDQIKFERRQQKDEIFYQCPYCQTEIPAIDLFPDEKGELVICPVCGKLAEI
jgi:DNA-directed RNA polymerase subunit RPC12/RpoP